MFGENEAPRGRGVLAAPNCNTPQTRKRTPQNVFLPVPPTSKRASAQKVELLVTGSACVCVWVCFLFFAWAEATKGTSVQSREACEDQVQRRERRGWPKGTELGTGDAI